MAATDKSRQTCPAFTRTPTSTVVLRFMVISLQDIVVKVSISKTTFDIFQLTIRLNIPTVQNKSLESNKTTCKTHNDPTITMTARCFFCTPLPSDHVQAPRSNSKSVCQFTALKSRRSSSIPLNVPQIRNKASESYISTCEPLNNLEMFLVVPFNNPTVQNKSLESHKTICKPHNDPTITMTARCFFCTPLLVP
jgi:hypothetical protein